MLIFKKVLNSLITGQCVSHFAAALPWLCTCVLFTSQWKLESLASPYSGNSGALDRAYLLNEANFPLWGAISPVKTSLLFVFPRAIQNVKNHKCTVLTINIFFCRIERLQIIESAMQSISHIAKILKVEHLSTLSYRSGIPNIITSPSDYGWLHEPSSLYARPEQYSQHS